MSRYIINDDDIDEWINKLKEVSDHLDQMLELDLKSTVDYVREQMELEVKQQEAKWKDLN